MEANTPAWHEQRAKGIGSSDIAPIMGKSPFTTPYQLWLHKTGRATQKDNFAMARGREWEPTALASACDELDREFVAKHVVCAKYPILQANLDGTDGKMVLEAKVTENIPDEPPEHYVLQVQHQLLCADLEMAVLFYLNPKTLETRQFPINRDAKIQLEIVEAAEAFWKLIETDTPPELSPGDYVECKDEDFKRECEEFAKAKAQLVESEARLDELKALFKERLGARPGMKGFGIAISQFPRKGNVDYGKIPQLKGVDLEPYRKKSSQVFMVRET